MMGDVYLYNTDNGGDISITNGVVEISPGLTSAVYISLFGGNFDDAGGDDTSQQFWANFIEPINSRRLRSRTQNLIQRINLTSGSLATIQDAVRADLDWMLQEGVASSLEVAASIPGLNQLRLDITIVANDEESTIVFTENWRGIE